MGKDVSCLWKKRERERADRSHFELTEKRLCFKLKLLCVYNNEYLLFLGGWLVVENASKLSFFYRDPERPFDTDRPRNWGSFGAELNGLKPWRRGGFRCFLGGWLVVENARKLFFF